MGIVRGCLLEPLAGRPAASGPQHVAGNIKKLADSNCGIPVIVNLNRLRVSPSSRIKAGERRVGYCSEKNKRFTDRAVALRASAIPDAVRRTELSRLEEWE